MIYVFEGLSSVHKGENKALAEVSVFASQGEGPGFDRAGPLCAEFAIHPHACVTSHRVP